VTPFFCRGAAIVFYKLRIYSSLDSKLLWLLVHQVPFDALLAAGCAVLGDIFAPLNAVGEHRRRDARAVPAVLRVATGTVTPLAWPGGPWHCSLAMQRGSPGLALSFSALSFSALQWYY